MKPPNRKNKNKHSKSPTNLREQHQIHGACFNAYYEINQNGISSSVTGRREASCESPRK